MKILLLGCGNIGSALLNKWQHTNNEIVVVQPSLSLASSYKCKFVDNINKVEIEPDFIVLAIKPQIIDNVLPELKKYNKSIIISLLAGTRISKFNDFKKVIRIMPNVAIKIAKSINLTFLNKNITETDKTNIENLFNLTGKMVYLKNENNINDLTMLFGSGPAYYFLLSELLVNKAKEFVDENQAKILVQQLFESSAILTQNNNDFQGLLNSVVSKKGCTESALTILIPELKNLLDRALDKGLKRLEEL